MADSNLLAGLSIGDATSSGASLSRALIGSSILGVIFVVEITNEYIKVIRGERPDYVKPAKKLLLYFGMLLAYETLAFLVVDTIMSLGTLEEASNETFKGRARAFKHHMSLVAEQEASFGELVASYLLEGLMQTVTWTSYALAAAAITVFKAIQRVGLQVALSIGPVMIALSAVGGPFRGFIGSWVLALVELSLWGFIALAFVNMLDAGSAQIFSVGIASVDTAPNYVQHALWNAMYVAAFFSIPALASLLVRGQATGGMAQAAAAGVQTAAVKSGAAGRSAASTARAGVAKAGSAVTAVGARASDGIAAAQGASGSAQPSGRRAADSASPSGGRAGDSASSSGGAASGGTAGRSTGSKSSGAAAASGSASGSSRAADAASPSPQPAAASAGAASPAAAPAGGATRAADAAPPSPVQPAAAPPRQAAPANRPADDAPPTPAAAPSPQPGDGAPSPGRPKDPATKGDRPTAFQRPADAIPPADPPTKGDRPTAFQRPADAIPPADPITKGDRPTTMRQPERPADVVPKKDK